MQLEITELQFPGKISFNYEELKQALQTRVSDYASMVYTEDQIAFAKKDRADLNRLKKALNDERIRQEKEFMKPFDEFKAQVKELCTIIDKASGTVDAQVKAFEEQQKADKLEAIRGLLADTAFPVSLEKVLDPKWLNSSVSLKSIRTALEEKKEQIMKDMAVVDSLPSYAFEARQVYLNTLDLAAAVSEAHRLQELAEKKAAWEAEQAKRREEAVTETVDTAPEPEVAEAEVVEPSRQWIGFQAFLSVDEAKALGAYLRSNGIKYKAFTN